MSHYEDIGFKVNSNQDVIDLFNKINSDKNYHQMVWDISSNKKKQRCFNNAKVK